MKIMAPHSCSLRSRSWHLAGAILTAGLLMAVPTLAMAKLGLGFAPAPVAGNFGSEILAFDSPALTLAKIKADPKMIRIGEPGPSSSQTESVIQITNWEEAQFLMFFFSADIFRQEGSTRTVFNDGFFFGGGGFEFFLGSKLGVTIGPTPSFGIFFLFSFESPLINIPGFSVSAFF